VAVHRAFMLSIADNQGLGGDVPFVVPGAPFFAAPPAPFAGNTTCLDIAWTSGYPQMTNMLHTYYGDLSVLRQHWPSLVAYQVAMGCH
jgi:hypothetical protein